MKNSLDDYIISKGLPSIYTERYLGREFWESITDKEKVKVIDEYIKLYPSKQHFRYLTLSDDEKYHVSLFYKHVFKNGTQTN